MSAALRDRYVLESLLGSGGMADVHRATDTTLERSVAVKVLRDVAGDESARHRFVAEARTLAGLSHRNLVTVLDAGIGEDDDRPFLVMELVEGRSLADALEDGPLTPEDAAAVGAQVAAALTYAHGRGVVHRDVKPGNVLLGGDGRVKLADFGIARLLGDTARHTRTGTAIGTAAYLAPEQVRGEDVTGAADTYALGLVLLEALTGRRAFPGSPTEAALARLGGRAHPLAPLLKARLAAMHPAYFALAMATGIVAIACHLLGLGALAVALADTDVEPLRRLAGLARIDVDRVPVESPNALVHHLVADALTGGDGLTEHPAECDHDAEHEHRDDSGHRIRCDQRSERDHHVAVEGQPGVGQCAVVRVAREITEHQQRDRPEDREQRRL